ncbi:polysaccharide deacetylase family protein [Riemerella anatipestifer]|uniref:polysaccharide deacetylase family protein n=1 Tax=Riemerella anatipestifer TaxID=34085 RepID=UPI000699E324|nr:polysaccharide deacetylase family protein [Riemerella anatipestifer]MDY3351700.1 polysaccharide deacetylase family protein [Riemerella anatipestifer]
MKNKGKFIISLDFELHWGGVEKWKIDDYKKYFFDTRLVVGSILSLFEKYDIRATWATVGFLFANNKGQLMEYAPELKPTYNNTELSYYNYFNSIGENEKDDPFHFAPSLIADILKTKGQELASHTFSHYYCNEEGQKLEQFEADMKSAQKISKDNFGVVLSSLVFPRNQYNQKYLQVVKNNGVLAIRSNPSVWFWEKSFGKLTSIFRAIDTLFSISKPLSYKDISLDKSGVIEIPASRFFRPYIKRERWIQQLKITRIKNEMTYAAKNNLIYHLWWHPHNFANNVDVNLEQLEILLKHYKLLNKKYRFQSYNMKDFSKYNNI